jgi:probable HAF family extracellular repeat protein
MKPRTLTAFTAVTLFAALAMPVRPEAQEQSAQEQSATQEQKPEPVRYTVKDLGTLGGPGTNSTATQINNAGWVTGSSNLTAGGPQHAFLWYGAGSLKDLGTLDGPACPDCNSGANGPNASGEAAVSSETHLLDPNGEDFCEFGTHHQCLPAIWKSGAMKALPTLRGGNNASAFNLNKRGQVIGFSENGTPDSTCLTGQQLAGVPMPSQVMQFEAVLWGPNGQIRELHPYPGDTVGFAFGINDNGQIAGSSGLCSNTAVPPSPNGRHAVLWEKDGSPTDLGNLGGTMFNIASSVNNQGEVVGSSQSTDGTIHAFLWTKRAGIEDLGAFPGAVVTVAPCCNTINNRGEVVGFSIDASGNMRALAWQGKVPVDLNTLIPAGSPWYLQAATSINDAGEIVGWGTINGEVHAFLATPCDRNHADLECCRHDINGTATEGDESTERPKVVLPESARKQGSADLRF